MTALEKMTAWLQTFPLWQEESLSVDYVDALPGNAGLYPEGLEQVSRREDVLGNVKIRCSCAFVLRRAAGQRGENARWLLEFQNWVMEQDRLGLAPKFGDEPKSERLRAFEGKLDSHHQAGGSMYTVLLTAEFTKLYEVN